MDNTQRSHLLARLTNGDDPAAIDRAMRDTYDLDALSEACGHWRAQAEHANKIACALSHRMDQIRGS